MNIVIISALYPPNFIGGATVQAQRIARGLADRGHHVRVFAGALDHSKKPLSMWEEVDEHGVRITWLCTTPWFGFGDEMNHDNPQAAEMFEGWLSNEPAEIVHAHAMQGLGSGLIEVAAQLGSKVVVTMHDWWWFCARQFLADRSFMPCCPVVEAGTCPCEVDRPWLDRRNRLLGARSQMADLILAPSRIAVRSLIANGVDPDRIDVDENGLPDTRGTSTRPTDTPRGPHPIRFMFAGGSHEMKGIHVVAEAVSMLKPGEWSIDLYGSQDFFNSRNLEVPPGARILPSFAPEEADAVFAEHDVLVLASVMRESHSLVTREALSNGVPVICSDSWGPEEVIEHGVNGSIFPSGDAAALASAMTKIIDDPDLLEHLKAGCREVPVRAIEDQVDGLIERYQRLLTTTAERPPSRVQRVLFITGIEGAPLRYRAQLPAEALSMLGVSSEIRHYQDPELERLGEWADTVVVYRVPATTRIMSLLADARRRKVPLIFDVDDLIFDPLIKEEIPALKILPSFEAKRWLEGIHRYRIVMEACDVYVGSTKLLCDQAESRVGLPARRFANGVGARLAHLSDMALRTPREQGPPRVAYLSGTATHDMDWAMVEPAVMRALERVPEAELWMVGLIPTTKAMRELGPRLRKIKMQPWDELPTILRQIDVNLGPLEPGTFNEAKSAIKWLEAALCQVPTIASPTQPFREAVIDGMTGILATSSDEWEEAIVSLLRDPSERARLGTAARREALFRWSPLIQGRAYLAILEEAHDLVASGVRPSLVSPLTPSTSIVHDEPVRPHPLEPYDLTIAFHRVATAMPTDMIRKGETLSFELPCQRDGLARVDLLVASYAKEGTPLVVELVDASTGEILRSSKVDRRKVRDRSWMDVPFPPVEDSASRPLRVDVRYEVNDGGKIALWANASGTHLLGGRTKTGGICVRAWATPSEFKNPLQTEETVDYWRKIRARFRYGIYTLRTTGIRGVASWVRRAIYLRTYERRRN